jgi:small-conductance mechanosensitive channel
MLKVLAAGLWVTLLFGPLGLLDPMIDGVTQIFSASISVGAFSVSLGDLAAFVLVVWLSFLLAHLINFFLQEDVFTRVSTGRGVPAAITGVVRYTLVFLGFLFGLAATGIELANLSIIAGGLGVGIGFGLQNMVNNFVSGLILLFERPIGVGDIVELPDTWGEVKRIGIRASVIHKFDGSEVIVPNGMLVSDKVTNWTLSDRRRRVELDVGVKYGTPAQRVIDLLLGVAKANPKVVPNPEPRAFFVNFGDSALEFKLWAWVTFDDGFSTRSDLAVAIQEALERAGIGVPFPQRDLHLVSVSPNAASDLGTATRPLPRTDSTSDPGDGS